MENPIWEYLDELYSHIQNYRTDLCWFPDAGGICTDSITGLLIREDSFSLFFNSGLIKSYTYAEFEDVTFPFDGMILPVK